MINPPLACERASRADWVAVWNEDCGNLGSPGRLGFIVTIQHKSRRSILMSYPRYRDLRRGVGDESWLITILRRQCQ